jgi:hypothetical protein
MVENSARKFTISVGESFSDASQSAHLFKFPFIPESADMEKPGSLVNTNGSWTLKLENSLVIKH